MITSASELLKIFIEEEKRKLDGFNMPHMPTLGNAYEEITKQGIDNDFVIPRFLNLRVVSGFVEIGGVQLSQQIDCMLVQGEGKKYGLTDQYIYGIDNVLCIFEVKKTLTKSDCIDALDHLGCIRRKFSEYFEGKITKSSFEPEISHARKSFGQITGKMAPERYQDIGSLPEKEAMLFYSLIQEQYAPTSIVHGYGGYKTEQGLRAAFIDIIEDRVKGNGQGLGVPNLPNLVISNDYCLIKGNGHPYLVMRDQQWVVMFSTRYNPAKVILEVVWAKIASCFQVRMPYGDDLIFENVAPLLVAEAKKVGEQVGWAYQAIEYKEKNLVRNEESNWGPERVGPAEISAINLMAINGGYLELDDELEEYLMGSHCSSLTQVVENLLNTKIFARAGNCLRPISQITHVLTNDDESGYVATDQNRFDAWCKFHGRKTAYLNLVFIE